MHGVDEQGKVRVGRQLVRGKVLEFFVHQPPCLVGSPAARVAELTPRLWKQHFAAKPLRSALHTLAA